MVDQSTLHCCPSPECAARGHHGYQPAYTPQWPAGWNPPFPNATPSFPTAMPGIPVTPVATGMFWTREQLNALMNEVRKAERATVLAELEMLKQIPATED